MTIKPEEIAVLTLYTPEIEAYGKIAARNREWYCDQHGYACHVQATSLRPERHPSWSKLDMAADYLKQYKWLFWLDADAMIMNPHVKLEEIIGEEARADFIVCADFHGLLNAGAWFVRNTDAGMDLLRKWMASDYDGIMWEQVALWRLFAGGMPCVTRVMSYHSFNSYVEYWRPGHFVLHFTGGLTGPPIDTPNRVKCMEHARELIKKARNTPEAG